MLRLDEVELRAGHLEVNLASPITKKIEIDLLLLLTSTENSSDQSSSADIVAFKEPFRPTFIVGNERYVMEFSWSLINPTSGFTTGSSLAAYEGAEALAELRVRILNLIYLCVIWFDVICLLVLNF